MENFKRRLNLVVVSHPDDEVLGFGGTGAKLVKAGEQVQPVILCGEVRVRSQRPKSSNLYSDMITANETLGFNPPVVGEFPNIRMNTVDHLDIVRFIEEQILSYQPVRIFTHHPSDLNDDHVQTMKACLAAARLFQRRGDVQPLEAVYFMEILSSTDWSFPGFKSAFVPDTFSDIGETLDVKLLALSRYRDVMRLAPHPRSQHVLTGHAAYRGGQSGFEYAEAFQTAFRREV
jgi:LmbE family N-acetylglucosaminyl deacetylase